MQTVENPLEAQLAYWRVRCEVHDGVTRIHVPPLPGTRHLSRSYLWVVYPILAATFAAIVATRSVLRGDTEEFTAQAATAALYSAIAGAILLMAVHHLRRYRILEIDSQELRLLRVRRGTPQFLRGWKRERVRDAHFNRSNGKLWLSIRDSDPVEIYLTSEPAVNVWIIEQLNAALHGTLPNPAESTGLWYASAFVQTHASTNPDRLRRVAIALSMAIAALGIASLFTSLFPLGCYLLLFSGVPAGIVLGVQKKDYYM